MDIGSWGKYPANALSNFAPHPFVIEGIKCASMEGFLQSLKFKNPEMQKEVCKLVGRKAKFKGKKKNWWREQVLWWKGKKIDRHSKEYQDLLDKAFQALGKNKKFRKALLATGDATLTHNIGKKNKNRTILTVQEFTSRLHLLRSGLQAFQNLVERKRHDG